MTLLLSLLLAVFLDLFGLGVLRPILPLYVQSTFGVDVLQVSLIPALFGVGKLLADLPAGLLMDRLGRGRLMAAGLLLVAAVDVFSAVETRFARFLVWRAAAGLGFGFFVTTAATLVLDLAPPAGRSRYVGSYLLIGDVGAALGAATGGWLYEQFGTRAPFLAKAAFAAAAAFLAGRGGGPSTFRAAEEHGGVRTAIGLPGLLPISLVNMVLFMADVGVLAVLFPLLLDARGLAPGMIGLFVALVFAAQLASLSAGSRLADRWGKMTVLVPGLLLYAGGLFVLSTAWAGGPLLLGTLLIGTGSGAARAVPAALVGDLAGPSLRGAAMGVFRTFTDIGMVGGPGLLGLTAARSGYTFAFLAMATLLIVNAGVFLLARPSRLVRIGEADHDH